MLTGTPLDLTPLGGLLSAVGVAYWVVVVAAVLVVLAKAKTGSGKVLGVMTVLIVLVGPTVLVVGRGVAEQKQVQSRSNASLALFKERCKSAGEKIHKTVDGVDGVAWLKWRPRSANLDDQFRLDDPFGHDCGGADCILALLRVTRGADKYPLGAKRHPGVYRFVESVDPADGRRYRYVAVMAPRGSWTPEEVEAHKAKYGRDPVPEIYAPTLEREPIESFTVRYGITWDDLSTREDREHWIAGGSLKVVDLQANEVIAVRVGFMLDVGQGNTGGGRQPWTHAVGAACPEFAVESGRHGRTRRETQDFVARVLKPNREE